MFIKKLVSFLLVYVFALSAAQAGVRVTTSNGITLTGADGVEFIGTNGITLTGADGFLSYKTNGITLTGAVTVKNVLLGVGSSARALSPSFTYLR